MTNHLLISLSILLVVSCKAQLRHKDQMEYGFKGNVKVVTKRVYPNPIIEGDSIRPNINEVASTYTYFFNANGNIDSAQTEYTSPSGDNYLYKTIFKFDSLRRSEWIAIEENGDRLLTGNIKWASDKEYTEKVFALSANPKYETTSTLNDSFRIIKTKLKAFDELGNTIQDDIQEFELDRQQNVISYKTTHQANGQTEVTDYKYLKIADIGNPTELLIIKREKNTKTLVRLEYAFY